jgi:hypothetical protein
MMNPLDQIEARLQALIESSALLIHGDITGPSLAHLLVQTMRSHLLPGPDQASIAPGLYIIHLKSLKMDIGISIESKLASILQESARDAGISFITPPVIRVVLDPNLVEGEINIEIQDTNPQAGYTAVILPEIIQDDHSNEGASQISAYLIVNGSDLFPLERPVINIGRRHDNHLVIDDARVSRNHCQLRLVQHSYVLFDLNSTGGSFVNNIRVNRQTLKEGDVISLAGVQIIYGEDTTQAKPSSHHTVDDHTANFKRGTFDS